jgi:hypothetical protein
MAVRKTESRIPASFTISDLGQAVTNAASSCSLVSCASSPLIVDRKYQYVVFVTDNALANNVNSFSWTVTSQGGAVETFSTPHGELFYDAEALGNLQINVRLLDAGASEIETLTLQQSVIDSSDILEDLIEEAIDEPGAGMANPEALRELVNEHNLYYQEVRPTQAEPETGFKQLVFNMAFEGVVKRKAIERQRHLEQLAEALNEGTLDFVTLGTQGAGVCAVRMLLLAMTVGMLPWSTLPEASNERALAADELHRSLETLSEDNRIDLFNITRFPKSNITWCGRILENLRNQYFNTTTFDDVITGLSGARMQWIIAQYRQGPITRNS